MSFSSASLRAVVAVGSAAALAAGSLLLAPGAQAATVYTLEPLHIGYDDIVTPTLFRGALCAAPNTCTVVDYPSTLNGQRDELLAQGAANLDAALRADPGEKIGFGHSMGSQAISRWLREYADDPGAPDPATTSFVLVGNPENTYGVPWVDRMPVDTPYDVTAVWVQYDGWADWPARFNPLAYANAVYGMLFVHPSAEGYQDMALDDPAIIEWQDGNTTYRMRTTDKLPILDPLRNIGFGWLADAVNDPLQEYVESAYDRPRTQAQADELTARNAADADGSGDLEDELAVDADLFSDSDDSAGARERNRDQVGTADADDSDADASADTAAASPSDDSVKSSD